MAEILLNLDGIGITAPRTQHPGIDLSLGNAANQSVVIIVFVQQPTQCKAPYIADALNPPGLVSGYVQSRH